jgi:hypothetical protein
LLVQRHDPHVLGFEIPDVTPLTLQPPGVEVLEVRVIVSNCGYHHQMSAFWTGDAGIDKFTLHVSYRCFIFAPLLKEVNPRVRAASGRDWLGDDGGGEDQVERKRRIGALESAAVFLPYRKSTPALWSGSEPSVPSCGVFWRRFFYGQFYGQSCCGISGMVGMFVT